MPDASKVPEAALEHDPWLETLIDITPQPSSDRAVNLAEIYRTKRISWISAAYRGDVADHWHTALIEAGDALATFVLERGSMVDVAEPDAG